MSKQKLCKPAIYVKPLVDIFELEPEGSLLLTASDNVVRFGSSVPGANATPGAKSSGRWSSSPNSGNNAVSGAQSSGKWSN